jgi:hypothetical protein
MKAPFFGALMTFVALGCSSSSVTLVAPQKAGVGNCFDACEKLFGARPTLNCGERTAPGKALLCSYDRWPKGPPAAPQDSCRDKCAREGFQEIEACWSVDTQRGEKAVACQYRAGSY